MREVNFSLPSSNKASVGITTALYDRRALDCTSTLPLINSLNHLCYLTQSSARIREILTVDGGIERLVCILKNGRSKDVLGTWKWNLALQCVYNIGVRGSDVRGAESRGSENIRMRVVEADIVPVLATVLDNYVQVVDRIKARDEDSAERSRDRCAYRRHRHGERTGAREQRSGSRREAPPPITIPPQQIQMTGMDGGRAHQPQPHHHHHHHHHHRRHVSLPGHMHSEDRSPTTTAFSRTLFAPSRGADPTAPPMSATSQPDTPSSPGPVNDRTPRPSSPSPLRTPRRPSIRHQHSTSGDSDDGHDAEATAEPRIEIQGDEDNGTTVNLPENEDMAVPNVTGNDEAGTFNITHRSTDGSLFESNATTAIDADTNTAPAIHFSPVTGAPTPERPRPNYDGPTRDQMNPNSMKASVPRDEDVIMSLQLLAYVSKYSDLRTFFQQSHLVPRLKIKNEIERESSSHDDECDEEDDEVSNDDEYCQPSDYNIFPLVEKFTLRHHAADMKYWAGVVLRNLCRKDRNRGDIRQCAYYKCGKWEDYAKQFAKCRRCRQTKYCSKECQKL